jgi:MFS family permease
MAEFLAGPWRTAWLLATSILAQFGGSLYMVNSLPFMMGATGAEERPYAFSVHFALIPLAAFVGSLIAGVLPGVFAGQRGLLLEQAAPYRLTLWVAALLLFPGALLLLRTRPAAGQQTRGVPPSHSAPPANRVPYALIAAIALIMGLRFGGRATTLTFFNVYLDDGLGISTALIGTLTALAQLLSVPVALCAPLLVGRWGNARIIFLGTLGSGLSVLLLALFPHWVPAGIGFVSSNALFAMTIGPIRVFSQELVALRWRASMASAFMMGAGLAFSVVSFVGGYIIVALGYPILFLLGTALVVTGALVFWSCFRVPRGELAGRSCPGVG